MVEEICGGLDEKGELESGMAGRGVGGGGCGVWGCEDAFYGCGVGSLVCLPPLFLVHEVLIGGNRVRSDGNLTFTGLINVTIMEMSLVMLHRRNMLMCAEWYVPFFFLP